MNNILLSQTGNSVLEIIKYTSKSKNLFIHKKELPTDLKKIVTDFVAVLNNQMSTTLENFEEVEESFNLVVNTSKEVIEAETLLDFNTLTETKKNKVRNFFNFVKNYNNQ